MCQGIRLLIFLLLSMVFLANHPYPLSFMVNLLSPLNQLLLWRIRLPQETQTSTLSKWTVAVRDPPPLGRGLAPRIIVHAAQQSLTVTLLGPSVRT
jgi:hypothetical protein